ncbi:hypothetical protein J6590_025947 [Homalodisca vitripennis]|nr:hypothetical protein J6590_025947 [Homalodisca vitripennis]
MKPSIAISVAYYTIKNIFDANRANMTLYSIHPKPVNQQYKETDAELLKYSTEPKSTDEIQLAVAKKVSQLLKDLSRQGRTIVCTIHQPSATMFHMFDVVYMLARGQCIYQGSSHQLVPFLSNCGLNCPATYNPADYGNCPFNP